MCVDYRASRRDLFLPGNVHERKHTHTTTRKYDLQFLTKANAHSFLRSVEQSSVKTAVSRPNSLGDSSPTVVGGDEITSKLIVRIGPAAKGRTKTQKWHFHPVGESSIVSDDPLLSTGHVAGDSFQHSV